jgi:hypothetical protein
MKQNNSSVFAELLLVAFIVLKLAKVINWSWWWVMSPLWITAGLAVIALGIGYLVYLVGGKK